MKRTLLIGPDHAGLEREHGLTNVNGPSLLRVPNWVERPLGRYYLYFAHHRGASIRLAYADAVEGPYTVYAPGALRLEATVFDDHIASPDVHVDETAQRIVLYFHGRHSHTIEQQSCVAVSRDGLQFEARREFCMARPYLRRFEWRGAYYATHLGWISRADRWDGFYHERERKLFEYATFLEAGAAAFGPRHTANRIDGDRLTLYYSRYGDTPERLMASTVQLTDDWLEWEPSEPEPIEVLRPVESFEGVDLPVERSRMGFAAGPVHQLRDPAIYREGERVWLLYSVAGESGIAITELPA